MQAIFFMAVVFGDLVSANNQTQYYACVGYRPSHRFTCFVVLAYSLLANYTCLADL